MGRSGGFGIIPSPYPDRSVQPSGPRASPLRRTDATTGSSDDRRQVQAIACCSRGNVSHQVIAAALDEPLRAGTVSARRMCQPHTDLSQSLPQIAFARRACFPARLEHLMRGERPTGLDQGTGQLQRLLGWKRLLGHGLHARRSVRKWPAQRVPRTRLPRPPRGVTIPVVPSRHHVTR